MTNREIGKSLGEAISQERLKTNEVLKFINLGLKQRAYLEHGFSSMHDWLTKGFGYSNGSAYRRIQAARMLRAVPEISENLEQGLVNLTTLCRAQVLLNAHEKNSGEKIELNQKSKIVELIKNKSETEAERTLLAALPGASSTVNQDRRKNIDAVTIRHSINLSLDASQDLDRAKELLSHKFHDGKDADIVTYALQELLKKIDPLRRRSQNPAPRTHRIACTYQDPITGKVCGSRYQLQWDHIVPKALGGSNDSTNFRRLCRAHNMFAAEQLLGKETMEKYRKPRG